ncbi:MAG: restriction endonuclease subunit M [Bacilli bacterium]|jgi:hypothetical protein|nr:restriction endonuclease subunit M [Bacilli bacterium]
MFNELVDIKEDNLLQANNEILITLLLDNTTKKNIIWASDNYKDHGFGFNFNDEITIDKITGIYGDIIKPRSRKNLGEKRKRIKDNAEVFTPSWICNEQNNLADDEWFGKKNVFNTPDQKNWITNENKIEFTNNRTWQDYVKSLRLEISCGEAPYLVSRYDTVTGKSIKIKDRIGLLDRKLRVLSENIDLEDEWIEWSIIAVKSIYGYDWQGDNILLARENILYTYIDYYKDKFKKKPSLDLIKEIAQIISWNIWQMDGLKFVIPNSCKNEIIKEFTLFGDVETKIECSGCKTRNHKNHNGIYCKIMNWEKNKIVKFYTLINKK